MIACKLTCHSLLRRLQWMFWWKYGINIALSRQIALFSLLDTWMTLHQQSRHVMFISVAFFMFEYVAAKGFSCTGIGRNTFPPQGFTRIRKRHQNLHQHSGEKKMGEIKVLAELTLYRFQDMDTWVRVCQNETALSAFCAWACVRSLCTQPMCLCESFRL